MAQVYGCQIPASVSPGEVFEVRIPGDHRIQVRCPPNMRPGDRFQIVPASVVVPPGAQPNQHFTAMVNNTNTTIRCPKKVKPGDTITIFAPVFPSRNSKPASEQLKTWDRSKWESYLKHMQETTPEVAQDLVTKADGIDADEIPQDFVCSITEEIMSDPVLTVDGFTYERKAIEPWLDTHDTSPKTNMELPSKILIPNRALRSRIVDFLERYTPKPAQPEATIATNNTSHDADLDFTNGAFSSQLHLTDDLELDSDLDSNHDNDDMGVLEVCQIFVVPQGRPETKYDTQTDDGLSQLRHTGFEIKQACPYRLGARFKVLGGTVRGLKCIVRTKRADGKGSVEASEKPMGNFSGGDDVREWSFAEIAPRGHQAMGKYESSLQFVDSSDTMHFQCVLSHMVKMDWN
eukprot:c11740_g1_i1.p1 GENE.c11740_g1_i1~~c11740_g1_i1.p1  ORF type:complete len:404 (+),score=91.38 c11740_g1_i1:119-1330(+)